ncbi:antimicrobial peptide AmAMP1-like isoform X2 [Montipora capricornis]|uniref:antimicrobial peptide AmAMP1-like isoform X2 n=1 Tax=Montipora foliosa TaxID=591990 RepID=UPI0035F21037
MLAIKVLFVLLAAMLLFMETKKVSGASFLKDVDDDEILLNEEDETVEDDNTFDATKSEDTADFSDLNDLVNNEKRGTCYDRGSKTYCKLVRIRGDCRSRLYRARSASRRCVKSCGICYG